MAKRTEVSVSKRKIEWLCHRGPPRLMIWKGVSAWKKPIYMPNCHQPTRPLWASPLTSFLIYYLWGPSGNDCAGPWQWRGREGPWPPRVHNPVGRQIKHIYTNNYQLLLWQGKKGSLMEYFPWVHPPPRRATSVKWEGCTLGGVSFHETIFWGKAFGKKIKAVICPTANWGANIRVN